MSDETTLDTGYEPSVLDLVISYGEAGGYNDAITSSPEAVNVSGWQDAGASASTASAPVVTDTGSSSFLDALAGIAKDTSRLALDWFNAVGGGGGGVQSTAGTVNATKAAKPTTGGTPATQAAFEKFLPYILLGTIGWLVLSSFGRSRSRR